ncbi:MAG: hypothetical protein R2809_07665 [Flavobacteriales bacterium]
MIKLKFAGLFIALFLGTFSVFAQSEYSRFPSNMYWVNLEYNLEPSTFDKKLMVVITWDINDPVGLARMYRLQKVSKENPQIQLVSIIKGDLAHPYLLSELIAIGQAYNLNHPFGVTADLFPYMMEGEAYQSKVFVYDQSTEPAFMTNERMTTDEVIAKVESMVKDKAFMKKYTTWQMKNTVDPKYYADPLLEFPMALDVHNSNDEIYIAENSQSRIASYHASGDVIRFAGGPDAGDRDGNLQSSRIGFVSGLTYDSYSNQVFFVDLQNQKIKAVDFKSELVYTVLGNGSITNSPISELKGLESPLCYPVDVVAYGKSLYILMSSPAQLVEMDISSGKFKSNIILETKIGNGRPIKVKRGDDQFLIVTNSGDVYSLKDEEDKKVPLKMLGSGLWEDKIVDVEQRKDDYFILMPRKHGIYKLSKGKSDLHAGQLAKGFADGDGGKNVGFSSPQFMVKQGNKLVVSDFGNHCLRQVNMSKGETNSIYPRFSFEYMLVGDAMAIGEPIFFETEVFGDGVNTLDIHWDLGDWTLDTDGTNELVTDPGSGVEWQPESFTEEGVRLTVDTDVAQEYSQVELYLTLRSKTNPNLVIFKRGVLNINFAVIPGESKNHEVDFYPHLLP